MKAKIKPRILLENRTRLEEVIPLSTPWVLFIDVSSVCNFQCIFCPCGDREQAKKSGRKKSIIKYELFRKIVDDLTCFPQKIKVIHLYKEGEPLLNKHLPEMIQYAKQKEIAERIDFTTNGSLLSPEKNMALIHAGLDRIIISVEALSDEKYQELSKVKIDFNKYVENIHHFYENRGNCKVCIKSTDIGVPNDEREKFFGIFGDMADEIFLEKITPVWPDHDLSKVKTRFHSGIYGQNIEPVQVCPYIFYSITINSDGTVSACFVDWEHRLIIGDVTQQSLSDIWKGYKINELRQIHLRKCRSSQPVCKNCGQLTYGAPDNIDAYADILLQRLSEKASK
jgi:radical SAM protein with 4Fe4S-binding SPASM domain